MLLTQAQLPCHPETMPYHTTKRPKSRKAIKALLEKIATKQGAKRWEQPICARLDVGPYAPRNWLERGIPFEHWPAVAELAGVPESEVAAAHVIAHA